MAHLQLSSPLSDADLMALAQKMAQNHPLKMGAKQLFIDISELVQHDAKSGIQRVTRSILSLLLENSPEGYRVEPVYASLTQGYHYARQFSLRFLNSPEGVLVDEPISFQSGDIFLGLDLQPQVVVKHQDFYQKMRRQGVNVQFVVYDLLCILMPQFFVEGASQGLSRWLEVVSQADGALCISKVVADELLTWLVAHSLIDQSHFKISWFNLGADIEHSQPSFGLPARTITSLLFQKTTFLMVGTLEPRKGHAQTLKAFEQLWMKGLDIYLVIVGKKGWLMDDFIYKLNHHPQLNKRLFWLESISDEYLQKIYKMSTCLIAASEGEGFGLPLIEAAKHQLNIIARDIPVFKEVAAEHAHYFSGLEPDALTEAIEAWLLMEEAQPSSKSIKWLTWQQSVEQLLQQLLPA